MFCPNCGATLPDGTPTCTSCGASTAGAVMTPAQPAQQPAQQPYAQPAQPAQPQQPYQQQAQQPYQPAQPQQQAQQPYQPAQPQQQYQQQYQQPVQQAMQPYGQPQYQQPQYQQPAAPMPKPPKDPMIAVLLEILPGLFMQTFGIGNMYADQVVQGLIIMGVYYALVVVNFLLCYVLIGLITWPLTWLAFAIISSILAYNAAKKTQEQAQAT